MLSPSVGRECLAQHLVASSSLCELLLLSCLSSALVTAAAVLTSVVSEAEYSELLLLHCIFVVGSNSSWTKVRTTKSFAVPV